MAPTDTMAPTDVLRCLRKHLRMILLISLCATGVTALVTYLMPEKYEPITLVLVRPQERITILTKEKEKELLNFPVGGGVKAETPANTYMQVIESRAMAERIVRMLKLDERTDPPATTPYEKVLAYLKRRFRDMSRGAIHIMRYGRLLGPMPAFDEAVVNYQKSISLATIKDTYLFEIKYSASDPKEAALVANTVGELFVQYMTELNSVDSLATLRFIEDRLRASETDLDETRRKYREYKEAHKTISFSEEITEEIKLVSELRKALDKVEVQLAGASVNATPGHPKILPMQAEKDRLLLEIERRQERLRILPETERQLATLKLNLDNAADIYALIKREHEEARLRTGRNLGEIKIVSRAVPPLYPDKPEKFKYVLPALVIAVLIAIGLAFLLEYWNTTLERVDDVERLLQVRVLATLPDVRPSARRW